MDRWVRHLARVMGIVVVLMALGILREHNADPVLVPLWFVYISFVCIGAVLVCLAGIILSEHSPKKRND